MNPIDVLERKLNDERERVRALWRTDPIPYYRGVADGLESAGAMLKDARVDRDDDPRPFSATVDSDGTAYVCPCGAAMHVTGDVDTVAVHLWFREHRTHTSGLVNFEVA